MFIWKISAKFKEALSPGKVRFLNIILAAASAAYLDPNYALRQDCSYI